MADTLFLGVLNTSIDAFEELQTLFREAVYLGEKVKFESEFAKLVFAI